MIIRTRFMILVAGLPLALAGCECGDAPADSCDSATDCGPGESCIDGQCEADTDATRIDGSLRIDASTRTDGGPARDAAPCLSTECAATDTCFDGLDNDCNDMVDDGCACAPGSTARCLPSSLSPAAARCAFGEMTCEGAEEFGNWGPCTGGGAVDGGSSLYGCRRIGIMGAPGANPSANFQEWLEMQGAIVTRFHDVNTAPALQRVQLETFDLVIVDWLQRFYEVEESTTLADWVNAGGALMVMTGHDSGTTADRHLSLLVSLGPTFDRDAGAINGPATLLPHPTTMDVDGTTTLPPVSFFGGLRTVVPVELAATIVPMAMIGTDVVGVAGPLGEGHVLLFGDEWIEFDSEWSVMPPIPQFWLNTVQWLAPETPALPICE